MVLDNKNLVQTASDEASQAKPIQLLQKEKPPIILHSVNSPIQNKHKNEGAENDVVSPPEHNIDKRNIFVKHLPQDFDDEALRILFAQHGTVVSSRVILDNKTGLSLGYGFVRLLDANETDSVISALNGFQVGNKTLLCKVSNPNSTGTFAQTSSQSPSGHVDRTQPSCNLYVKGIPQNYQEQDLRALFTPFGRVEDVRVMIDKVTNISKQIGFVRYANQQEAALAVKSMDGSSINNQSDNVLTVKYAETEEEKSLRRQKNQSRQYAFRNNMTAPILPPEQVFNNHIITQQRIMQPPQPYIYDQQELYMPQPHIPEEHQFIEDEQYRSQYVAQPFTNPYYNSQYFYQQQLYYPQSPQHLEAANINEQFNIPHERQRKTSQPPPGSESLLTSHSSTTPPPTNTSDANANLFVFHLPSDMNDQQLYGLFAPFGDIQSSKVILDTATGESKGYGFVKYLSMDSALAAISSMNGCAVGKKHLKVSFKTPLTGATANNNVTKVEHQNDAPVVNAQNFPRLKTSDKVINKSKKHHKSGTRLSPNSSLTKKIVHNNDPK
ncbi:Elavl4 [Acrasis kona]|uniref:Elavl4 n=1 Tax=Acrasis kona TaxID=1008807 RepID=A0AAW2YI78_9EUKA